MKKLLLSALALVTLACGPATPQPQAIDSLFVANNEIGTWVEDTSVGTAGVETARTRDAVYALINGDAEPFIAKGFIAFARERYRKDSYTADLRVWQMKDATVAKDTYDSLVVDAAAYKSNNWTAVTIGDAGRIADTGSTWWVNARKGAYVIEVKAQPKDSTTEADAQAFATAVAGKIR